MTDRPIHEMSDPGGGEPRRARERGTGLISTLTGFIIFLMFMFLAIHLLMHLYASSLVSGAAFDAASTVASASAEGSRSAAAADAEAELRNALGAFGHDVAVAWTFGAETITVRVTGRAPSLLPTGLTDASGLSIDKSVTVRVEEFRPSAPAP